MKTISKMGISTIQSYCGAQIFEAVGLDRPLIDLYFTGTASRIGGVGLEELSSEAMERHFRAYPRTARELLPVGGVLQWRRDGELHVWNPDTVAKLQHAVGAERRPARDLPGVRADGQRAVGPTGPAARADGVPARRRAGSARGGRAGDRDRQAIHDRRDEPGRAEPRGARDAGDRDEPDRRRAPTPAKAARTPRGTCRDDERRSAALGDQAGRLRPVRRHDPVPGQRRPAPDQDGPGRQAGRGRPAARPQGRLLHREDRATRPRAWV